MMKKCKVQLISNKEVNAQVIVITEEDLDLNHLSFNEDLIKNPRIKVSEVSIPRNTEDNR